MVKNKNILLLIGVICSMGLYAQDYSFGYLVEFTDKANTIYSVEAPEEFLSERAIVRRSKYVIEITEQDFPVNKTYTDSLLNYNSVLHVTSRWFNSAVFYTNSSTFANQALSCSFVSKVTLVFKGIPNKAAKKHNKWVQTTDVINYGSAYDQIAMCKAQKLHNNGYMGDGIQIAVLDGGFWRVNEMACFDSLYVNNRILGHWDFVSHNDNVFDDHTHGMGVLSTMGGNLPGELVGTAPNASYYLFRTENVYSEYPIEEENWIAAAEVADSAGVDIITASLGYSLFDDDAMNYEYADMDGNSTRITKGAEVAFAKGIFLVNSAGNEGNNNWHYITAPSDGEHVLCVGAVDAFEVIAPFSSRGPSYDGRVKPDVVAMGHGTTIIKADETVGFGSGTSFSCPVMAGMVACLWQVFPMYSNQELLDLIRSYSDKYNSPNNNYGYGLPDFSKATFVIDSSSYSDISGNNLDKAYPNPFNDKLSFHLYIKKGQEVKIVLHDALGIKVYSEKMVINSATYNLISIIGLSKLNKGCYFLTIYTNEGMLTKKLMR